MGEPADFKELSPRVRAFLANLTDERIEELETALELSRSTRTVSRFMKWSIISVAAFVVATAALGDAVQKIWGWISPTFSSK